MAGWYLGPCYRLRGLRRCRGDVVAGWEISPCQSLMPPVDALLLAPRATWLGRFSISLALPREKNGVQISAAGDVDDVEN